MLVTFEIIIEVDERECSVGDCQGLLNEFEEVIAKKDVDLYDSSFEWEED